jgi:hypothetical protein
MWEIILGIAILIVVDARADPAPPAAPHRPGGLVAAEVARRLVPDVHWALTGPA